MAEAHMPTGVRLLADTSLGPVIVESSDGDAVAVGKLVLTGDVEGAPDFHPYASAAPAPGTYWLKGLHWPSGPLNHLPQIGLPRRVGDRRWNEAKAR